MKKKNKNIFIVTIIIVCFLFISIFIAFQLQNYNANKYQEAYNYYENEEYQEAEKIYAKLGNYKDSKKLKEEMSFYQIQLDDYILANNLLNEEKYIESITILEKIKNYKDSAEKLKEAKYNLGIKYYENNDYENAKKIFTELGDYLESTFYLAQIDIKLFDQSQEIIYQKANLYYEEKNYSKAIELYTSIISYKDSKNLLVDCKKQLKRMSHNNIMSTGVRNSATITNENNVKVFGNSDYGQNNVDDWKNIISIDIYGNLIIGLQDNGRARIAGTYDGHNTIVPDEWINLIDVAAGEQFVVGLKENGNVIADGHPGDGQLKVDDWKNVVAIDAGSRFTVALTEDKKLLFAGFENGQAEDFENHKNEWINVVNISASGGGSIKNGYIGGGHTVGLNADGTLIAVGDNTYGQCDFSDKEKWSDIVKVATGDWYTIGLKSNGTVVITGENSPGNKYIDKEILENYNNIVDIAAGYGQTLLLTDKGEIICFGFVDDDKDKINGYGEAKLPQY